MSVATPTPSEIEIRKPAAALGRLLYLIALLASISIWFLALRAPLWLDETLAYWQVSGGFAKIWTRSQMMPSSIGYLYTLWFAKSILGTNEMALKIPSLLATFAAAYFLFRAARELFDQEIAYIAAAIFCLETNVVFAATDARPYAFALLATNLAIFAFIRWMKHFRMKGAILFAAAAAGILYFHYLFGAILPAFAIYYLVARWGFIKQDLRQLAAVLATFAVLALPVFFRIASLYRTRVTHVVQEMRHPALIALNTLAPMQTLIALIITLFLAALVRKIKSGARESFPVILLPFLLAVVPAIILSSISSHLVIPRYFSVVAPGSALTWALLTSLIDSRILRKVFCVGLVAVTVVEAYGSPSSRRHELSFKHAHDFVNANVAQDKPSVLVCSAFIESDYEPLPTDRGSENALAAQVDYYPIHAPVLMLPMDLNDEAMRIGSQAVTAAAQRHQRFLVVAAPTSYKTVNWLIDDSRGSFTAQMLGEFDEIVVVEFRPLEASE